MGLPLEVHLKQQMTDLKQKYVLSLLTQDNLWNEAMVYSRQVEGIL